MTDLIAELAEVVLRVSAATPEKWTVGPYGGIYKTGGPALLVGASKSGPYENRSANEAAACCDVNFLRTHHAEIEAMARENEALRLECNFEREKFNRAVKVLSGIYAVIYPRIFDVNGKRYAFHSPIIHEQMQAFSDRIRAIPDEIAAMHDSARESGES